MTECYIEPHIKPIADFLNHQGNSIIGLYFQNSDYSNLEELDSLDNYIQVFATNKMKGIKIDNSILEQGLQSITGSYLRENWERLANKLEEKTPNIKIGQPFLVESYGLTQNSKTAILLSLIGENSNQTTAMLSSINLLNIKGRLVFFSYYLAYRGQKTIKTLKAKNDYYILSVNENN